MLRRDDIGRHLTSEMFFSGDRLPGFSDTIEHPDGLVLVDTGMIDTTPAIEDDGEEWHPNPLPDELVSRVAVVVNTHLHFDHCGGNRLFPGIPIHVQRRELADARTTTRCGSGSTFRARRTSSTTARRRSCPASSSYRRRDTRPDIRSSSWRPTKARSSSSATRSRSRTRGYAGPAGRSRTRGADLPRACRAPRTRGRSVCRSEAVP